MLVGGLQAPTHMVQSLERFSTRMLDPVLGSFQPFREPQSVVKHDAVR